VTTITANSTLGVVLTSPVYANPVVVDPGVTISSPAYTPAVYGTGQVWTISNLGTLENLQDSAPLSRISAGILLAAGGSVSNAGLIASYGPAIEISGGSATVTNTGTITDLQRSSVLPNAVYLKSGGTVTNQYGGAISGTNGVIITGGAGTVENAGSIVGTGGTAVSLAAGFANSVVVDPGAVFTGTVNGGNTPGAAVASTLELVSSYSYGTLSGLGVQFVNFTSIHVDTGATWIFAGANTVQSGATLTGYANVAYGTLTNAGLILSRPTIFAGATLTNTATGVISAAPFGVKLEGGTLVNAGSIGDAVPIGEDVYIAGGGRLTNLAGGVIEGLGSGGIGSVGSTTIVNAGTIGRAGESGISFAAGYTNLLVVDPGAVFAGKVNGGNAVGGLHTTTLEFASGASSGVLTGLGTQFVNFGSIVFDANADWLIAGNAAGVSGVIAGFAHTDTIEITGITTTQSSFANGVLTLTGSGATTTATLDLAGNFSLASFNIASSGGNTEVTLNAACFRAGTRIETPRGQVSVEKLAVGDTVLTLGGATNTVVWIGWRRIDCARHRQPQKVWPICVHADAFGPGQPARDLFLSPDHAVFVNEVLIPVGLLTNGVSIVQMEVDEVTYYHLELSQHEILLAEGLPVESYLDAGDRSKFSNSVGATDLFPDFATPRTDLAMIWEGIACAPLVVAGAEFDAAKYWLNARAAHVSRARPVMDRGTASHSCVARRGD
jgi:hypothetical protein